MLSIASTPRSPLVPAEWEPHRRTWMAWPVRPATWRGAIEAARATHAKLARAIAAFEPVTMVCAPGDIGAALRACGPGVEMIAAPLSDGWMRDIGPTFVRDAGGLAGIDWIFNGWGGLHDEFGPDAALAETILTELQLPRHPAPLVFEGGAFSTDGAGTILLTEECALDPGRNPGRSKAEIEEILRCYLGARSILWLGRGYEGDETKGHVDEIAAFVAPGKVVISATRDPADSNYPILADNLARLRAARDASGRALEIVEMPEPAPRVIDGQRLTLSYVNFAVANGGIILPQFDDPADREALAIFERLFPDRRVIPFLANDLVIGGGGIHCVTLQEPAV